MYTPAVARSLDRRLVVVVDAVGIGAVQQQQLQKLTAGCVCGRARWNKDEVCEGPVCMRSGLVDDTSALGVL